MQTLLFVFLHLITIAVPTNVSKTAHVHNYIQTYLSIVCTILITSLSISLYFLFVQFPITFPVSAFHSFTVSQLIETTCYWLSHGLDVFKKTKENIEITNWYQIHQENDLHCNRNIIESVL